MFRKITALGAMLLCVLLSLQAQAQRFAGTQCADPSQSLLWHLESAELNARGIDIHLFGSIHVGKREFYPLPAEVEAMFRSADNLVFEVDPQAANNPQTAMRVQLQGMLPSGQTLQDVLSAKTLSNLEVVLASMNIPMANFMNFKPWMIALLLTNLQASSLGFDPLFGLESYLISQKSPQTQILELESMQQQLDMLEVLDPEIFLGYSLEEFSSSAETMSSLVEAWLCGDKQTLQEIVFATEDLLKDASPSDKQKIDQLYEALFTKRNKVMADGIENFAQTGQGSYFVVVGAGHLLGEGSVVELLQQRGFGVSPVTFAP